jgi:hypothetical protein
MPNWKLWQKNLQAWEMSYDATGEAQRPEDHEWDEVVLA